jgi:hypothetical protein
MALPLRMVQMAPDAARVKAMIAQYSLAFKGAF